MKCPSDFNFVERFISHMGWVWSRRIYDAKVQVMSEDKGYIWSRQTRKRFEKRNPDHKSMVWSSRVNYRPCMQWYNEWYMRWFAVNFNARYMFFKNCAIDPHRMLWGPKFWDGEQ